MVERKTCRKEKILRPHSLRNNTVVSPLGILITSPMFQKEFGRSLQLKTANRQEKKKLQQKAVPLPPSQQSDWNASLTTEKLLSNSHLTPAKNQLKKHTHSCPSSPLKFQQAEWGVDHPTHPRNKEHTPISLPSGFSFSRAKHGTDLPFPACQKQAVLCSHSPVNWCQ